MPVPNEPPTGNAFHTIQPEPVHLYGLDDSVFEVALHEPAPGGPAVPEVLVQDVWAGQRFDTERLTTTDGTSLRVADPGTPNHDGGPDFRGARLYLGGQEWYGDVEIHLNSGAWLDHRHQHDERYNSVVLHVVLYPDLSTGKLLRADQTPIPELILQPYLNTPIRSLVHGFYTNPAGQIACAAGWPTVPARVRDAWIGTLGVERQHAKRQRLARRYLETPDLEALLYEQLMAGLGYAPNAEAMRSLARRLPLALLRSLAAPQDLEALLFGVAGLLPTPADLLQADRGTADYTMDLRERYERLDRRLAVPPMSRASWQFFRLRPANFPTRRIAQAAALLRADPPGLLHQAPLDRVAAAFREEQSVDVLRRLLSPPLPPFWIDHVRLDRHTKAQSPALGRSRADVLIVNAIAPVVLLYAEQTGRTELEEAVFQVLRRLPPERDEVGRIFEALGSRALHALAAQGFHQLYRTRCAEARCLHCEIGRHLLDPAGTSGR